MYAGRCVTFLCLTVIICISCTKKPCDNSKITQRVDSLLESWRSEIYANPGTVRLKIIDEISHCNDSVDYYRLLGLYSSCLFNLNKTDSALAINHRIVSFYENQEFNKEIEILKAKTLNDRGIYYQILDKKDSAIICLNKAVEAFENADNKQYIADIYINIADCYSQKGDNHLAADYYFKSMSAATDVNEYDNYKFPIYAGLAKVYADLRNFPKAAYYFDEIENEFADRPFNEKFFYSTSRGNYHYSDGKYRNAQLWFEIAHKLANEIENPYSQALSALNLGEIYLMLNQPDSARYFLDLGKPLYDDPYSPSARYYIDGLYASLHLLNDDFESAEKLLTKDYSSYPIMPLYIYYNNKRLEELYRNRNDFRKAYMYRKFADDYNDSLRNVTLQNNLAEMNLRHERDTMLLNRDIRIVDQERQVLKLRSENYLIILVSLIICLIIISVAVYLRQKRMIEINKRFKELSELRVINIKKRMDHHFVKNVVTGAMPNLRQSVESNKLDLLIKTLRNEILNSNKIFIKLEEEIEVVNNYIELIRSSSHQFPQIRWDIGRDVDLNMHILSMIIEIPVENAIKSAFPNPDVDDYISISIKRSGNIILIEIIDNGVGFRAPKVSKSESDTKEGLRIINQTIELMNSRNKERMEFNMLSINANDSLKPGTKVEISIPIIYRYEL